MSRWFSALVLIGLCAFAAAMSKDYKDIEWIDLLPPDELEALMSAPLVDHSRMFDPLAMDQGSFRTVEGLDGEKVRIPGYIVPLDQNEKGEMTEFFLVPYFGACIHTPPPPPNQILHGKLLTPMAPTDIYSAFWIEGTMRVRRIDTDLASSAYQIETEHVRPYE